VKIADYRVLVTATRGEQLVVERQYQASPNHWVTIDKYLTADINKLPKQHGAWAEEVPALFKDSKVPRCLICDFPLASAIEDGCVPGNCSYRPPKGTAEYQRIQRRREELRAEWDKLDDTILGDMPVCPQCGQRKTLLGGTCLCADCSGLNDKPIDPEQVLPSIY